MTLGRWFSCLWNHWTSKLITGLLFRSFLLINSVDIDERWHEIVLYVSFICLLWTLLPASWSLVRERVPTTGLNAQDGSLTSGVCRWAELLGRSLPISFSSFCLPFFHFLVFVWLAFFCLSSSFDFLGQSTEMLHTRDSAVKEHIAKAIFILLCNLWCSPHPNMRTDTESWSTWNGSLVNCKG